jgi:competence protein ComEC
LPYLRKNGVRVLQTLVVSHGDSDHSAGTATLLNAIPIEQLIVGGEMQRFAQGHKCRAGQAWRWPSGVKFQFLSPEQTSRLSTNNSSCVLRVQIGEYQILLSGDIDAKREKALVMYWRENLHSHVLLAAHHGSISSSSFPWLKTVQPEKVAFSHGYLNQFGHPHEQITRRFGAMGSELLSTARLGALEITIDSEKGMKVEPYRSRAHRYWM